MLLCVYCLLRHSYYSSEGWTEEQLHMVKLTKTQDDNHRATVKTMNFRLITELLYLPEHINDSSEE